MNLVTQLSLFGEHCILKKRCKPVTPKIGHKIDHIKIINKINKTLLIHCDLCDSKSFWNVKHWYDKTNDKKRSIIKYQQKLSKKIHKTNCGCRHNSFVHGYTLQPGTKEYKLNEIYKSAKARAKKRGKNFKIDLEYLESIGGIPDVCPILKIPLKLSGSKITKNSPTLDEIRHGEGYIKGNVRIVSQEFNRKKGDLSIQFLDTLKQYMKGEI
tara:strand:+ start:120 stop:755 length:636 start_codon:yes stop_codon:yes gene_type:complete